MNYTEIMVRYGELSTKGKNRRSFIMQLAENVKRTLARRSKELVGYRLERVGKGC